MMGGDILLIVCAHRSMQLTDIEKSPARHLEWAWLTDFGGERGRGARSCGGILVSCLWLSLAISRAFEGTGAAALVGPSREPRARVASARGELRSPLTGRRAGSGTVTERWGRVVLE